MAPSFDKIPDLTGCLVYCPECRQTTTARRMDETDATTGQPYSEFVCDNCHWILLTFHRSPESGQSDPMHLQVEVRRIARDGSAELVDRVCDYVGRIVDITPVVQRIRTELDQIAAEHSEHLQ